LFIPDPFFRTNVGDQGSDPIIEAFTNAMPEGLQLHYVDNWDVYHLALGEVHCGTNVLRTPTEDWWTSAMHLLEDPR
jgi:protein-arginine deiminase